MPQDTLLWTGRLDYNLNERSTLNVRYAFQDANQFATVTQPYSAELDQPFNVRNQNITLNLTRFLSGNFFTESRVVFSRLFQQSPAAPATEFPSFTITGDTISGSSGSLSLPSARNAFGGSQRHLSALPRRQLDSWNSQSEIRLAVPALAGQSCADRGFFYPQ